MSSIIKPNSPSRLWRKTRRKRPEYPALNPFETKIVSRPECGRNVSVPFNDADGKRQRTVLNGAFVMQREPHVERVKRAPSKVKETTFNLTAFQDTAHKANVASLTKKLAGAFGGCTKKERAIRSEARLAKNIALAS